MQLIKKTNYIIITILVLSLFVMNSCKDSDAFSSDPSLKLNLGTDFISFDTVFTSLGSATKHFKIYNPSSHALNIQSVRLIHPETSGFKVSIDGEKGKYLQNITILKKDSLFCFVKVGVNPLEKDVPTIIRDTLEFYTNGNIQLIALEAIGQNVVTCKNLRITGNTVFTKDKPYLIYDSLVVEENATLLLDAGAKLYFRNKAALHLYGSLVAHGTINEPVVLRGDRNDNIQGDIPFDRVSGQWKGIYVYPHSFNNLLENVRIKNSRDGMLFMESTTAQKKATLINTMIHNTSKTGVTATNCNIEATNCLFTNSKGSTLSLNSGKYNFLHCTIANYYRWSSRIDFALVLNEGIYEECNFTNCFITGSTKSEIGMNEETKNNFQFINCFIRAKEIESPQFKDIVWNGKHGFKELNSNKDYVYDFNLTEESAAINNANREAALLAPFDMNGNSRINDSNPDIGCYEWTNKN